MATTSSMSGFVCDLSRGLFEFTEVLSKQTESNVVLVLFSAKWCTPCKRIKPLYYSLAATHVDVTFVYVDCEKTDENRELAQQMAISGFPSFSVYKNGNKIEEWSGADFEKLERVAMSHSSIPKDETKGKEKSTMQELVHNALVKLRSETDSFEDFVVSCKTIITYVKNILQNPELEKYRKVKVKGAAFLKRLGRFQSGQGLMMAVGFERVTDGTGEENEFFLMKEIDPELSIIVDQLEAVLPAPGPQQQLQHDHMNNTMIRSALMSRNNPAQQQQLASVCAQIMSQIFESQRLNISNTSTETPRPYGQQGETINMSPSEAASLLNSILGASPQQQQQEDGAEEDEN